MSYLRTNTVNNTSGLSLAGVSGTIVDSYFTTSTQSYATLSQNTGNGTRIEDLTLRIKPKRTSNIIICEWGISGEVHHDGMFLIHKRTNLGSWGLATTAGEEGYNNTYGNQLYSGMSNGYYDGNYSSTPANHVIRYSFVANTTEEVDIAVALRHSSQTYTNFINRTTDSWGQQYYEVLKSYAWLFEVYA